MRFPTRFSLYIIPLALLAASCPASASDWPQFRGPDRNGQSPETGLLTHWPESGPPLLWTAEGLGAGFSSAVVSGDTVYVTGMREDGAEGLLHAFDLDGNRRWSTPYGPEWDQAHPGSRYPPTFAGGRAYLLSGRGVVTAIDAATGEIIWQRDIAADFGGEAPAMGFAESLLIDRDHVIVTPGGPDASVVALNRENGETRWTSAGLSDQSAYCSPILIERGGARMIVTLVAATLAALDPETGALIWRVPFDENEELQNHAVAPVYENGLLYATSGHRKGGVLYELAPDGQSITERWRDEILNNHHGGVIFREGYLYGATLNGRWVCLAAEDGALQYEARGVGKGSITYADGHFYCYSEKGALGLVPAIPGEHAVTSEFRVNAGRGPHWAHPTIAGGRLYLRHGDVLRCYDLRQSG
ncbi:MAG: PQQ-binding-like beta-propeller repeat protein [Candidatus Hydrogenedentes bacterium]|nr:PQQ-binding-like beta-propeller repeat protein [Candidatus Hydrogenedentota bacterium]